MAAQLRFRPRHAETPQETRDIAAAVLAELARRIVASYGTDSAGARDALLHVLAVPVAHLTLLEQKRAPHAGPREIGMRLTEEFARRLDAWAARQ